MIDQSIKEKYFQLLTDYLASPQEKYLVEAAQIGRQLVLANIPPEEIAGLQEEMIRHLGRLYPDDTRLEPALLISIPLIELFMAYGLHFRQQIEVHRRDEAELKKYRDHLESQVRARTVQLTMANKNLQKEIMERKLVEAQLRDSKTKYSTLVEQARESVAIVQDGIHKFVNRAAAEMIGSTIEELTDKTFLDIVAPECWEAATQKDELCLSGEKNAELFELKYKCKDKTIKEVQVSLALIQYNGQPAILKIARDITERKKMEEELQKMQKLESVGLLAGGIAHDFNNLLTGIMGNLSLAELYVKPGDTIFEILKNAKNASQHAGQLTQQLLTFSKGGAPIKKTVSISELIKETTKFVLRGSHVRCESCLPNDLWPVEIDKGQISQVINNLVINANQAMPEGGIIKVGAENVTAGANDRLLLKDGKYVKLSVQDQGVGISKEHLQKIFDPYFTTKKEGSGLGLATCYSIIKNHRGHITVESEPGAGTTFHIYLPVSYEEVVAIENIVEKGPCFGKGKILFMDDEQDVIEAAEKILTYLGYEVAFARNGAQALELYKKAKNSDRPFDAAILDLTIPGGMGGKKAIQKLFKIDPKVKAIVSSGYSNDPIMSDYGQYGFKGVVVKPYEINILSETLHRVMR